MSRSTVRIEGVSKEYRLGVISSRTLQEDLQRRWARWRGRPDPLAKVGVPRHAHMEGTSLWALRDVSLDVHEGEVLGLIGRNGAGKTTLLKILSRITAPTRGEVKLRGRVASLLEVGTGFHPELTGRENVYLNGAILGMSRADVRRRFEEIVEFSGLSPFVDTPVKRYSSGMYIRLAFAVAAHLECEVLLVDEILAVGDAEFQKRCLGKMREVSSQHRTVVFVSHNLSAVSALCDRVVLLEKGEKHAEGAVDDVVSVYARLIGSARNSDLTSVRDRGGSGVARIDRVRVTDLDGVELRNLQAGGSCVVEIGYSAARPISQPTMYIGMYDALWRRVAFLDSSESGTLPPTLPAAGRVRCVIEMLPLPPGVYFASLALKEGGDHLDQISRAFELHLIHGDFYRTGVLHGHARACLVQNRWEAEAMDLTPVDLDMSRL